MQRTRKVIILAIAFIGFLFFTALIIFMFFPKLYTNPDSINDFNTCYYTGYPITPGEDGGKACTLPNGDVFQSNFG